MSKKNKNEKVNGKFPKMMYGLNGICELLGCSLSKASAISRGTLAPACKRESKRYLVIDTKKAFELLGFEDIDRFVEE